MTAPRGALPHARRVPRTTCLVAATVPTGKAISLAPRRWSCGPVVLAAAAYTSLKAVVAVPCPTPANVDLWDLDCPEAGRECNTHDRRPTTTLALTACVNTLVHHCIEWNHRVYFKQVPGIAVQNTPAPCGPHGPHSPVGSGRTLGRPCSAACYSERLPSPFGSFSHRHASLCPLRCATRSSLKLGVVDTSYILAPSMVPSARGAAAAVPTLLYAKPPFTVQPHRPSHCLLLACQKNNNTPATCLPSPSRAVAHYVVGHASLVDCIASPANKTPDYVRSAPSLRTTYPRQESMASNWGNYTGKLSPPP